MNKSIPKSSICVVLEEIVRSQCDESLSTMNDKYNDYICSTVILNSNKIDIIRRQKNKEDILSRIEKATIDLSEDLEIFLEG